MLLIVYLIFYVSLFVFVYFFFFQAEDGIRDGTVMEFRRVLFRSTGEEWVLDSVSAVRAGGDDAERWIEVEKPWNRTHVTQRLVLRRDEPLLEIRTVVDWQETRKLLKVAFDWNVTADSALYEIAYCAIGQSTAPRTQAERAKYEHAGHRWGDLSDAGGGVSLLNDSKYGWD